MTLLETLKQQRTRWTINFAPDDAGSASPIHAIAVAQEPNDRWHIVEAHIGEETVTVLSASACDGDTVAAEVARRLAGTQGDRCAILIPDSRQSVCRVLDLPDVPRAQQEQMVALRLEVELPFPPQESTWTCSRLARPGDASARVVLLAAPSPVIAQAEARVAPGQPGTLRVAAAPAALVELATAGTAEAVAVAQFGTDHALLSVGYGGVLCYARYVRLTPLEPGGNGATDRWVAAAARELKQCLLDFGMRTGLPAPATLQLTGAAATRGAAIAEHLDLPVQPVTLPDTIVAGGDGDMAADFSAVYAIPLGALLSFQRERHGLPCAAPALRPARSGSALQVSRSTFSLFAVNLALLLAVLASVFVVQSVRLSAAERFVRESRPAVARIEALQEEVDILRFEERQGTPTLDILLALSGVLPPELKVEHMNLDHRGHLSLSGTTKSVEAVADGVLEALKSSTLFRNPQFKGATEKEQGFDFTLTVELTTGTGS